MCKRKRTGYGIDYKGRNLLSLQQNLCGFKKNGLCHGVRGGSKEISGMQQMRKVSRTTGSTSFNRTAGSRRFMCGG